MCGECGCEGMRQCRCGRKERELNYILVYLRTDLLMRHFAQVVDTFAFRVLALA